VTSVAQAFECSRDASFTECIDYEADLGTYINDELSEYEVFSSRCPTNEKLALTRRFLREVPEVYLRDQFQEAFAYFHDLVRQLKPMTPERLLDCYSGVKRRRYASAYEHLLNNPLEKKHFLIQSFAKKERTKDISGYPRMVHHISYEAMFELLRYIKPIEQKFYKIRIDINGLRCAGTSVAKGLNGVQRFKLIQRKLSRFKNPCILSLDCSSFELHVAREYLLDENQLFSAFYKYDKYFEEMLSYMVDHRGFTQCGHKWSKKGGRVSGIPHTALGNTLCMLVAIVQLAYNLPRLELDVLSDGDDTLLFMERDTLDLRVLVEHFHTLGHELRVDKVSYSLEDVLFCQHRFLDGGMVRCPEEILNKALVGISPLAQSHTLGYYCGIGHGLRATYGFIPELVPSINALIALSSTPAQVNEYWLSMRQDVQPLSSGRIFDIYPDCDIFAAEQRVFKFCDLIRSQYHR